MSQSSSETATLKPCPFCGCADLAMANTGASWVKCKSCEAEGPPECTDEDAARLWNHRFDFAQKPEEPHETTYLRGWNEGIERAAEVAELYPSSGEQTEHPVEYWIRRLSHSSTQIESANDRSH